MLRREHLGDLLEVWSRAPVQRELGRLILPLLELDPLEARGERVAFDPRTGLPLQARQARSETHLLWLPPGVFEMGGITYEEESPIHAVELPGSWLARAPVTVEEYELFLEAQDHPSPPHWELQLEEPLRPVIFVNWHDAEGYCRWAGGRLPSEAEWEYAARGQDRRYFPWGDAAPTKERVNLNPGHRRPEHWDRNLRETEEFPEDRGPFGHLGLGGNVREWLGDWFHGSYYQECSPLDPRGPDQGSLRSLRGASWYSDPEFTPLISSTRFAQAPGEQDGFTGFRLARDLIPK
jgi:iron(II)-dependent oxidoreductase